MSTRSTPAPPGEKLPSYVPYPVPSSKAQAEADAQAILKHNTGQTPNATDHVGSAVGSVISGTEAVGKVMEKLLDPTTWLRVGEVLVGTVLLVAGVDHIFGTNYTGKLAKVAPYMMV